MSVIQHYPEELDWANAHLADNPMAGSFLNAFCEAMLRADGWSYQIMRTCVQSMMRRFPAPPARLTAEKYGRLEP